MVKNNEIKFDIKGIISGFFSVEGKTETERKIENLQKLEDKDYINKVISLYNKQEKEKNTKKHISDRNKDNIQIKSRNSQNKDSIEREGTEER